MNGDPRLSGEVGRVLRNGAVIPAHPLALTAERRLDERRQRALSRYYLDSGAGGLAVGVHTTQFAIHDPRVGLYRDVLEIATDVVNEARSDTGRAIVRIAGVVGSTPQAVREASQAADLGYDVALVSFSALSSGAADETLHEHVRAVSEVIPVMGFYLQPAVGGRPLAYEFWREFLTIPGVVAIKVAPFDRYATMDVLRAVCDSGRSGEIALYTGNDDNIVGDLMTEYSSGGHGAEFVGGLLGHWAVWTAPAVRYWRRCRRWVESGQGDAGELLRLNAAVTDANAALFDASNGFAGCIAGIHSVLSRQGLMAGTWCLDENEGLSEGQEVEIDRVCCQYPELTDDEFVADNLERWLR